MLFAHWKNIPTNLARAGSDGALQRDHSLERDAALFIVDIPEGMSRDEVIEKLPGVCSVSIGETDELSFPGETDGFGFQEEWPPEIQQQFDSRDADSGIRSWANLK